jgi:FKBP-type peptidyl-prolyl cis-trans isomerase (trigger factor)
MNIEKKILPKSIVELILEESVENIAKFRNKAIKYIEEKADIKGFRKGAKIPESILVKQFGDEYIANLTIDFAMDAMIQAALKKENLVPVAQGEIKEIISQSPLKVKFQVEVLPDAKIAPEYRKIKIKKTTVTVSDDEVETAIKDIQTRFTKYEEAKDENTTAQM